MDSEDNKIQNVSNENNDRPALRLQGKVLSYSQRDRKQEPQKVQMYQGGTQLQHEVLIAENQSLRQRVIELEQQLQQNQGFVMVDIEHMNKIQDDSAFFEQQCKVLKVDLKDLGEKFNDLVRLAETQESVIRENNNLKTEFKLMESELKRYKYEAQYHQKLIVDLSSKNNQPLNKASAMNAFKKSLIN